MRNSRLAFALAAVACAAALPAAAAAHKSPANHGHNGKGDNDAAVRLAPATGQKAKGALVLKQHTGALSVGLIVGRLAPDAFYSAHLHSGSCAAPGVVSLALPDIYADEDGVAKLVTTLPTAVDFLAGGYYADVQSGGTVLACGDIKAKVVKSAADARLKGANHERGRAELLQKAGDVSVWIKVGGLVPGPHAVQIHAGTCDAIGAPTVSLGDVTAGPDGKALAKVTGTSAAVAVGKNFTIDVSTGPSTAPGVVVACGDQYPIRWRHGHH